MMLFGLRNPIYAALFIASYLAIIFVHEFGHAFMAHRLGYEVDSIWITFWHGWCRCEAPDNEWNAVLIAWGGVAAQIVVALPALGMLILLGDRDWSYFTPIIVFLGYMNILMAVTNLLPGEETDGRAAWRIVPLLLQERRDKRAERKNSRSQR